ncbi:hypothetical protein HIM_10271 [Hirsutella minnesotensis 3608]|uniref:Rhodopsin domain-containing protein n=1 Tax=Hirsutella minnesotensis 3608 TaxID=1043627 RepID=A0A0F7ZX97_9HYPO|nr:hypothetical protein HIM_10271 [Hirsutella minnesotensis 3608]
MTNTPLKYDPNLPDENRGQSLLLIPLIFSILITLSTTSRILVRLSSKVGLGAADYFNIIALAFNLSANIIEIQCVHQGLWRHPQYLSRDQALFLKRMAEYTVIIANISLWAVKMSVCFFLLALIQNAHQRARWIVYALMALTTAGSTTNGIIWGLQAKPLEKLWNPDIPGEISDPRRWVISCIAFTALNSITDLFYALSPIYFIGRLQLNLRRRLTIIALTGSGLLVFAFSIARIGLYPDFFNDSTWAQKKGSNSSISQHQKAFAELQVGRPRGQAESHDADSETLWAHVQYH